MYKQQYDIMKFLFAGIKCELCYEFFKLEDVEDHVKICPNEHAIEDHEVKRKLMSLKAKFQLQYNKWRSMFKMLFYALDPFADIECTGCISYENHLAGQCKNKALMTIYTHILGTVGLDVCISHRIFREFENSPRKNEYLNKFQRLFFYVVQKDTVDLVQLDATFINEPTNRRRRHRYFKAKLINEIMKERRRFLGSIEDRPYAFRLQLLQPIKHSDIVDHMPNTRNTLILYPQAQFESDLRELGDCITNEGRERHVKHVNIFDNMARGVYTLNLAELPGENIFYSNVWSHFQYIKSILDNSADSPQENMDRERELHRLIERYLQQRRMEFETYSPFFVMYQDDANPNLEPYRNFLRQVTLNIRHLNRFLRVFSASDKIYKQDLPEIAFDSIILNGPWRVENFYR